MFYIRKPLDVERWGKVELWEGIDAAYIIDGTEPERGPDAYLTNKATEVHQALLAAVGIGALKPWRTTENGASYFVAAEVVRWAKAKGFSLPEGLEAAVHATTLAFLARHKAEKEAQMRESAFSSELLGIWSGKDLWSQDEFVALLCGVKPEAFNGNVRASYRSAEDAARRAIQRGIAAETLEVKAWLQDGYEADSFQSPASNPYFSPAHAIAWAETKRIEFPAFPSFLQSSKAPLDLPKTSTGKSTLPMSDVIDESETNLSECKWKAKNEDALNYVATQEEIINAFKCRPDLFDDGHKFDWFKSARLPGRGGRNPIKPKFDPVPFAENLPRTTYGVGITERQAWSILQRVFPDRYAQVQSFDPRNQ